jgi:hypothetical protein
MERQIRSAEQMVKMFSEDTVLLQRLKDDPVRVLQETLTKLEKETHFCLIAPSSAPATRSPLLL